MNKKVPKQDKWGSAELARRIKYRLKFACCNSTIRDLIKIAGTKQIAEAMSPVKSVFKLKARAWDEATFFRFSPLHSLASLVNAGILASDEAFLVLLGYFHQSSINILFSLRDFIIPVPLYYNEGDGDNFKDYPLRAIKAVNRDGNTITIQIKLDQKKENIRRDIDYLLNLLEMEGTHYKVGLKRPKPRWDEYDKYLEVYALRKKNTSWRKIAFQIFPNDVDIDSAMRKVRHYYEQADRMINKGGWQRI